VTLEARHVRIYSIDLLKYDYPRLEIEVHCGKGTYIRSLARDLGDRLGCGALVESLRRTRVGPFNVEDAVGVDATRRSSANSYAPLRSRCGAATRSLWPGRAAGFCQGRAACALSPLRAWDSGVCGFFVRFTLGRIAIAETR
jgi:tRNA pseudouridine55 synthase